MKICFLFILVIFLPLGSVGVQRSIVNISGLRDDAKIQEYIKNAAITQFARDAKALSYGPHPVAEVPPAPTVPAEPTTTTSATTSKNDTSATTSHLLLAQQLTTHTPESVQESAKQARLDRDLKQCTGGVHKYQESKNAFTNACSEAGLLGRDTSCQDQFELCLQCTRRGGDTDDHLDKKCGELEQQETYSLGRSSSTTQQLAHLAGTVNGYPLAMPLNRPLQGAPKPMLTYQNCPAYAARDFKTMEIKLREDQRDLEKVEDEVKRLEEDIAKKEAKMAQNQVNFEKEMDAKQKEFKNQTEALINAKTSEAESYQQILDEIITGMEELSIQRIDAQTQYYDKIQEQVYDRCLTKAHEKISNERKQQLAQISAQTYKTSSLNDLIKRNGVSQTKRSKKILAQYAKECRGSQMSKQMRARLQRHYEAAQLKLNQKEERMKKMYKDAMDKLAQVQPSLQPALEKLHQEQMQALQEKQKYFEKNQQILQRTLAQLKQQLQQEQMELMFVENQHNHRADMAARLQNYDGGTNSNGRTSVYNTAAGKYRQLRVDYKQAVKDCWCTGADDGGDDGGDTSYSNEDDDDEGIKQRIASQCKTLHSASTAGDDNENPVEGLYDEAIK